MSAADLDMMPYCTGLVDGEGQPLDISMIVELSQEQRARYVASMGRMGIEALEVLADPSVRALVAYARAGSGRADHVVVVRPGAALGEVLLVDDGISYEQISPLQLVEYCFDSADGGAGEWMVCNIGAETLQAYSATKFGMWRKNMFEAFGGCAAAFLPELRRGFALSRVHDAMIFTSPPSEKAQWETEHRGKMVAIPRPVRALRVWDSSAHDYIEVSAQLPGAPNNDDAAERAAYWSTFLTELRSELNCKYGEDFIDDCLNMEVEAVKQKYGF